MWSRRSCRVDATKLLEGVASIAEHAPDYGATLDELIGVFHQLTTLQLVPDSVDGVWSEAERMRDFG
jgi:DNA polymerase-3 subunit gamma/tau